MNNQERLKFYGQTDLEKTMESRQYNALIDWLELTEAEKDDELKRYFCAHNSIQTG